MVIVSHLFFFFNYNAEKYRHIKKYNAIIKKIIGKADESL